MNKEKLYIDEKIFLKNYDVNEFERPSVTNDVIIFTTDDVLEENSRKVPRKGMEVLLVKEMIIRLKANGQFREVL